jgi:hypothetical protein
MLGVLNTATVADLAIEAVTPRAQITADYSKPA